MTAYNDAEQSVSASAPIEGYKFIGSFKTYRYTSSERSVLINGELYLPIAVTRSRAKAGTQEDDNLNVELEMPYDTDLVFDYAYAQTPPTLDVEIYRTQSDLDTSTVWEIFWKGKVRGFGVSGRKAKIIIPSIFSLALSGEVPNFYFQSPCNHVLFDTGCKAIRINHLFTANVLSSTSATVTINTSAITTGILAAGELVNLRTGERRLIMNNTGDTIQIGYPFVDIQAGDNVELTKGCNHDFNGDCVNKFANGANYGGYKYIPSDNPFKGAL